MLIVKCIPTRSAQTQPTAVPFELARVPTRSQAATMAHLQTEQDLVSEEASDVTPTEVPDADAAPAEAPGLQPKKKKAAKKKAGKKSKKAKTDTNTTAPEEPPTKKRKREATTTPATRPPATTNQEEYNEAEYDEEYNDADQEWYGYEQQEWSVWLQ